MECLYKTRQTLQMHLLISADGGVIDKSNAEQNSASDNPAESISDSEDRVKIYPNQRPGQEKPKMQNKFAVLMAEDRSSSEDDS